MRRNTYRAEANGNRSHTWCVREVATGNKVRDHLLNRAEATHEAMLMNVKAKQAAERATSAEAALNNFSYVGSRWHY